MPESGQRTERKSATRFPEGFWEWPEEKRAEWVEKFLKDAIARRREELQK